MKLGRDEVDRLGRVMQVAQQLRAWYAMYPVGPALLEPVQKGLVGKLADHDQAVIDNFESFKRQNEWMSYLPDTIKGSNFLVGLPLAEPPVYELDCLEQPTGCRGLPDLAKATGSQPFD